MQSIHQLLRLQFTILPSGNSIPVVGQSNCYCKSAQVKRACRFKDSPIIRESLDATMHLHGGLISREKRAYSAESSVCKF